MPVPLVVTTASLSLLCYYRTVVVVFVVFMAAEKYSTESEVVSQNEFY